MSFADDLNEKLSWRPATENSTRARCKASHLHQRIIGGSGVEYFDLKNPPPTLTELVVLPGGEAEVWQWVRLEVREGVKKNTKNTGKNAMYERMK